MTQPGGLVESLRSAAHTLLEAVQTRLSLFAAEAEEQGARYARIALLYAIAGFCLAVALLLGIALIVLVVPEPQRPLTLGLMIAVLVLAALAAVLRAQSLLSHRPPPFSETLAELERDRQAFGHAPRKP